MYKFNNILFECLIEDKVKVQRDLDKYGFTAKDVKTITSNNNVKYEVVLVDMKNTYPNMKYQIAIQREDGNAFDITSHDDKLKSKTSDFSVMTKTIETIDKWLDEHGALAFSSHSDRKRKLYKRIFSKHFNVSDSSIPGVLKLSK